MPALVLGLGALLVPTFTLMKDPLDIVAEVLWDVAPSAAATNYVPRKRGKAQAGWLAYVVGRRPR